MSSKGLVLAIIAGLACCLHGASSATEQEHALLTFDAHGDLTEDRRVLLRREGREHPAEKVAPSQVGAQASFCSNGGTSTPGSALEFSPGIPAPRTAPFTLALRVKFNGGIPGTSPAGSLPLVIWTLDKDTPPSGSSNQFYMGKDHEPPRIALTREGNVLMYEEYGKQGANTFTSNPSQLLNDGQYHDIVVVREREKISIWVDGVDNAKIEFSQHGSTFQTRSLPQSSPAHIYNQKASSENKYFKAQCQHISDFGRFDIMHGEWAFFGEVLNVRLYEKQALHANDFPDSSSPCEPPVQCDASCAYCNAVGPSNCTRCEDTRHLFESRCEFACPHGYYIDASANECKQCDFSCGGCSGRTTCTSCNNNQLLFGGNCIVSCPDNTFVNENDECQDIVGSVITLSHVWNGTELVLEAIDDWCIGASEGNHTGSEPVEIDEAAYQVALSVPERQQWIVAATGSDSVALRNVKTGKFLDMPAELPETCGNTLAQCVYASTTPMDNVNWALRTCKASKFKFKFVSLQNNFALHNSDISRFLQMTSGNLDRSINDATTVSPTEDSDLKRRFQVSIVHSPMQAEVKYAGRCETPVDSMIACRQAAATTQMLKYADFQEVYEVTHPSFCHFYEDTIEIEPSSDEELYTDYPKTIQRLRFNKASHADEAGPTCSGERPCLCTKAV